MYGTKFPLERNLVKNLTKGVLIFFKKSLMYNYLNSEIPLNFQCCPKNVIAPRVVRGQRPT